MLHVICKMLLKVNNFAADKGKSLISRDFIEAEMILFYVNGDHHMIYEYFQMTFYRVL